MQASPDPTGRDAERLHSQRLHALTVHARSLPPADREAYVRQATADDAALQADALAALGLAVTVASTPTAMAAAAPASTPASAPAATPAAGTGPAAEPRVHSTATADLMQRLAQSPSLDTARYAIEGEVDRGGMGAILSIHDRHLNRRLAMKVLLDREPARDDHERQLERQLLGRFLEEAQVTSQLDHPGVVPVHELGIDQQGKVFFTMRLVKGRTAGEVFALAHRGSEGWTIPRALDVVLKVCDTMAYAHDKGVLHRDLKPQNVMVGRFGEVYVMDWGLAKVLGQDERRDVRIRSGPEVAPSFVESARKQDSQGLRGASVASMDGQRLGTPSYMPPEQARGEDLDARADVYAIGAMLYELLAGRAPFTTPGESRGPYEILADVAEHSPKPIDAIQPGVPAALVALVDKAMARDRERRYRGTMALAADLRAFLDHRAVQAYQTGALVELRLWVRRNRSLAGSLAAAILCLVAGIVGTAVYARRAAHNEALATERAAENQRLAEQKSELLRAEATARQEFARKVDEFDQLAGIVKYERAVAREVELFPAWPERSAAMERWLAVDCEPLLAMRPAAERTLANLRQQALPPTAAERQRDRETHPRFAEWQLLQRRLASLQHAEAIRTGAARPAVVELTAEQAALSPDGLNRLVWDRVATSSQRRVWGEEAIALALARRAVARSQGAADAHKHLDALAVALFVNGLDRAAMETSDAAVAAAPAAARTDYEGYRDELQRAIDGAAATLREVATAAAELTAVVEQRRTWTFPPDREADDFLHDALGKLLAKIDLLADRDRVAVERRLRWARCIEELTFAHPNARVTWDEVNAQLANDPRYAESRPTLDPGQLLGLVPLGANPATGLFEFYHLRSAWDGESDPAGIPIPTHRADGELVTTGPVGMVFVLLPGATCTLGAQRDDPELPHHDALAEAIETLHRVTLQPFLIARHEMTKGQWARLCTGVDDEPEPSSHELGSNDFVGGQVTTEHPVEQVDWWMCNTLLSRHGLQLPSEAQWEYACRGGTTTPWAVEQRLLATYANLADEAARRSAPHWGNFEDWNDGHVVIAPVGSFAANAFGLYDLGGNVREWCRDRHGRYGTERPGDGLRPDGEGNARCLRGGCFLDLAMAARSAKRGTYDPGNRDTTTGVRAVRMLTR